MRTADLRPAAWHELRSGLEGNRLEVYNALAVKPATCAEVAARMGWPVTSVRPRMTELRQMKMIEATGIRRDHQHEFEVVRTRVEAWQEELF